MVTVRLLGSVASLSSVLLVSLRAVQMSSGSVEKVSAVTARQMVLLYPLSYLVPVGVAYSHHHSLKYCSSMCAHFSEEETEGLSEWPV